MRDMYTELLNPIYGTHDGLEVIVVGAFARGSDLFWIAVEGDGRVITDKFNQFTVDVRFADNEWKDVSPGPETPEG
jgi:hypothetical protein